MKDWWRKISRKNDGSLDYPFIIVMAWAGIVIVWGLLSGISRNLLQ